MLFVWSGANERTNQRRTPKERIQLFLRAATHNERAHVREQRTTEATKPPPSLHPSLPPSLPSFLLSFIASLLPSFVLLLAHSLTHWIHFAGGRRR